jgi:hypothetical protein
LFFFFFIKKELEKKQKKLENKKNNTSSFKVKEILFGFLRIRLYFVSIFNILFFGERE